MEESLPIEYLRAILLLGIATIIWVAVKLYHEHASKSLDWLEGMVEGYAINAAFWSGIIGLALIATQYNAGWILHLTLLILFTQFVGVVTFIEVSSTVMSIIWGIERQSNGRLDYRTHVTIAIAIVAIFLTILYLHNNLPPNPISFP